jgi:hypothetical protein
MKYMFATSIVLILMSGCTTSYRVHVSGYAGPQTALPQDARIHVEAEPNAPNPLFYNQIKTKILELLVEKGYRSDTEDARYHLSFNFGSDDRRYQSYRYDYVPFTYHGYFYRPYAYGFGYYHSRPYTRIIWDYWLVLTLRDLQKSKDDGQVVWVGEAVTSKGYADKREAVDYLLVALFRYFGRDTGKTIRTEVSEKDPKLKDIAPGPN